MKITYIPHSLIKSMHGRTDIEGNPYIFVITSEGDYTTHGSITTDANGITGNFKKIDF